MQPQTSHKVADISAFSHSTEPIRLAYLDHHPLSDTGVLGTVLLIHGFPQTSYQFRHILPLLAANGYRCIAVDYRGAGNSSKLTGSIDDYRKSSLGEDLFAFLSFIGVTDKVHIVGHDIGGMVAFAMASRHPTRVRTVCWGECCLPGTQAYCRDRTEPERIVRQFHFVFHAVPHLPEALIAGRERIYISHFLEKICHNLAAFSEVDIDHYAHAYEQPGAISCGLNLYRAFELDARENQEWIRQHGTCRVPTFILSGEQSRHNEEAEEMGLEVTAREVLEANVVKGAGHYLAEENPEGVVEALAAFWAKYR